MEKPKNPVVFSNDDKSVRETEKPKNDIKIGGFIFYFAEKPKNLESGGFLVFMIKTRKKLRFNEKPKNP